MVAEWRAGEKIADPVFLHADPPPAAHAGGGDARHAGESLRVITPEVGGGFGTKLNVYAEEALMGFIAMKIGKPVKWVESRRENFLCTIHGRGHVDYFELAAKTRRHHHSASS